MNREELLFNAITDLRSAAEFLSGYGWSTSAKITSDTAVETQAELDNLEVRDKLRLKCARDEVAIVKTKLVAMASVLKQSGNEPEKLDHIMKSIKWFDEDFELTQTMKKAESADRQGTAVEDAVETTAENAYLASMLDTCVTFAYTDFGGFNLYVDSTQASVRVIETLRDFCIGDVDRSWSVSDPEDVRRILISTIPYLRVMKSDARNMLGAIRKKCGWETQKAV